MASYSASDLKRRLERARRRQREVEQGRTQDESGIRPLVREPISLPSSAHVPATAPEMLNRRQPWLWPGAVLLLVGAAIGVWAGSALGPISFIAVRPVSAPLAASRPAAAHQQPAPLARVVASGPTIAVASAPEGAEIVFRGAVIANTPARVSRPAYPALYLLRRSGYHPQLVRVSPQSGDVVVDLKPLTQELPIPSPATKVPRTKSKPDRGRGHDVGRQPAPGRSDGLVVGSSAR